MRTIHTIRQLAFVACLSMLTMAAAGQQNSRQDRRNGSERNATRTESSQRSRDNAKAKPANNNSRQGREQYTRNEGRSSYESRANQNNRKDHYKRDDRQDRRDDQHYRKNDHKQGHYQHPKPGHKPSSAHVHHSPRRPVYHQPARVHHAPNRHAYYRHLPTKRVNRFHYNGYDYYHSNNHFYRYHPHHGYRIVEAPFTRVRYLPARYQVRVYNGYSYPYYNGFFFLPAEYGYVMVPAPARPHASFNIVLNL